MLINLELQLPQLNAVGLVLNPVGADWLVACPARFERATLGFLGRGIVNYPLTKRLSFAQFKVW